MAAIFKSLLQNLSPLPPRLKVKSTDLAISWTYSCFVKSAKSKTTDLTFFWQNLRPKS